jgi:hypothetical protein
MGAPGVLPLVIAIVTALPYLNSLHGGLCYDDKVRRRGKCGGGMVGLWCFARTHETNT